MWRVTFLPLVPSWSFGKYCWCVGGVFRRWGKGEFEYGGSVLGSGLSWPWFLRKVGVHSSREAVLRAEKFLLCGPYSGLAYHTVCNHSRASGGTKAEDGIAGWGGGRPGSAVGWDGWTARGRASGGKPRLRSWAMSPVSAYVMPRISPSSYTR